MYDRRPWAAACHWHFALIHSDLVVSRKGSMEKVLPHGFKGMSCRERRVASTLTPWKVAHLLSTLGVVHPQGRGASSMHHGLGHPQRHGVNLHDDGDHRQHVIDKLIMEQSAVNIDLEVAVQVADNELMMPWTSP
ncbi:hypothetical protein ACQJBY_019413 [Aegilops geniculata]